MLSAMGLASLAHAEGFDDHAWRQALASGDVARVDTMLRQQGRQQVVSDSGVTVLHLALMVYSSQRLALVQRVLATGADVNARMSDGRTPLHWAVGDCPECVALLLKSGARVDAANEEGITPIFGASSASVSLLLAAGADPLARNQAGEVPLHRNPQEAFLGAGIDVRDHAGLTPLHHAALSGNADSIAWLLARGADPKAQTSADTHVRDGHMSKAFGPGEAIAAGARPYDLARLRQAQTRFNTQSHNAAVAALEKVTPRRSWFRR